MRTALFLLSLIILNTGLAQSNKISKIKAFKRGEVLTYRVHYGFVDAGEATIAVTQDSLKFANRPTFHVVGTGNTKSAFDWFFKVRDRYDSWMDEESLLPQLFLRRVDEGGFIINQDYRFNHQSNTVNVKRSGTDKGRSTEGSVFELPHSTHDMISFFYFARSMNLTGVKIGDVVTVQTFFDEEVFPMQVKLIGRETLKTKAGKIRCLKLRPIIQKGRVFEEEEDLTLWVSDDFNRVPVRLQADVLVGSIKMDLKGFSNLAHPLALEK
ncbi:MAG: DUF3108 domain-containing protein [Bacteroidia bacterium]